MENLEFSKKDDGSLVCSFTGRIESAVSAQIEDRLFDEVLKNHSAIIFDLAAAQYVSSAFLRICVKTARASRDRIKIVNLNKENMKVFKMTGLDRIFDLFSAES